ncbi:MAG: leucyl aminopeptidase family protein [Alphaproteobacteria bacterium]|nr:leucyl aminopeptidase family protein [Alphaproteobacteria bacterium]
MPFQLVDEAKQALPLHVVSKESYPAWLKAQDSSAQRWLKAINFPAAPGTCAFVPSAKGELAMAVAGTGSPPDIWAIAGLASTLPPHVYALSGVEAPQAAQLALGWALGAYRFHRYKTKEPEKEAPSLALPGAEGAEVREMAQSIYLARDLINTPANDMLPTHMAAMCLQVAKEQGAKISVLTGEELLTANYPTIYTVGKASADAPRLIDLRWGRENAPKVTLVGKGVSFDSGGLDIKSAASMRLMKKDMGGAAIALGLARLVMAQKLDVRLRVLIPSVENAVGSRAMRPLDVVKTRKGVTVEIGNTDAEGRLILCDALAEADSEKPDLLVDFSTLTGAARVALGTDIPAFFTPDDALAEALARAGAATGETLYRLPLAGAYRDMLKSHTADLSNDTDSPYAGAITAALFLKEFVEQTPRWLHIDMMAWNLAARPGRPVGGEAQGLRAVYALLRERYGKLMKNKARK